MSRTRRSPPVLLAAALGTGCAGRRRCRPLLVVAVERRGCAGAAGWPRGAGVLLGRGTGRVAQAVPRGAREATRRWRILSQHLEFYDEGGGLLAPSRRGSCRSGGPAETSRPRISQRRSAGSRIPALGRSSQAPIAAAASAVERGCSKTRGLGRSAGRPRGSARRSHQLVQGENLLEPRQTRSMLGGPRVVREEQQAGVDQDQRWAGPSTRSRNSAMLSSPRPGRSSPRSRVATLNGTCAAPARRVANPRRRVSFTVSLNERPERRIAVPGRRRGSGSPGPALVRAPGPTPGTQPHDR